jgi:coenzyme F420-0:L-glutamate ligase/coenzyme F420-1:gamma-L-glutamate ligase
MSVSAAAVEGLPEIRRGDDLAALIAARVALGAGDIVVVAHKVVSKAEGAVVLLRDVVPAPETLELATKMGKDARLVQVILNQSAAVVRAERDVLICRTHHGFVCANAGVDASNTADDGELIVLPADPDASARALRAALPGRPAVLITDSFGRAWRIGQCDVAIGCAGLAPSEDWRGLRDSRGRELQATWIATADQIASAADLARRKDSREPVVVVRGLERHVTTDDGAGAAALIRPLGEDLFG